MVNVSDAELIGNERHGDMILLRDLLVIFAPPVFAVALLGNLYLKLRRRIATQQFPDFQHKQGS